MGAVMSGGMWEVAYIKKGLKPPSVRMKRTGKVNNTPPSLYSIYQGSMSIYPRGAMTFFFFYLRKLLNTS